MTAVVLTPTVSSAAITITTNSTAYEMSPRNLRSEMSSLLRSITRSRPRKITREIQRPITKIASATRTLIPIGNKFA